MAGAVIREGLERLGSAAADAIPQYRGAPAKVDPTYVSEYTRRPSTFTSSEVEEALSYLFNSHEDGKVYFHKFDDLTEDEIFDPTNVNKVRELIARNPVVRERYNAKTDVYSIANRAVKTGNWVDVEALAREGLFDDLPAQYKAIRLRGEADNYMYMGRQIPSADRVSITEVPGRKHYVGKLKELHDLVNKARALDPKDKAAGEALIANLKALERDVDISNINELAAIADTARDAATLIDIALDEGKAVDYMPPTNYILNAANKGQRIVSHILTRVDTKQEAYDLIDALIFNPANEGSRFEDGIDAGKRVKALLKAEPNEGFDMLNFIEKHNLYGLILPALGAGAALKDEYTDREISAALMDL